MTISLIILVVIAVGGMTTAAVAMLVDIRRRDALRRAALVYGAALTAAQCIVVGDTPNDVEGAHGAGIACVGVASHNFNAEQLRAGGADYVIGSLAEGLPL